MYNSYILTEKEKQIEDFLKLKESNYSFVEKVEFYESIQTIKSK